MSTPAHAATLSPGIFPKFAPNLMPPPPPVGRCTTTPTQGRALEALGHAIEYLVDSRLFQTWETPADAEAVRLLMACSRGVFSECEPVVAWRQRVQQALQRRLHLAHGSAR